jgi:hypothetical protein
MSWKEWKVNGSLLEVFESRPYEELQMPAEELSIERDFEGVTLYFSAEAYNSKRNGDH